MSTANPIETNTVDTTGAQVTTAQASVGKFDDILAATSYAVGAGSGAINSATATYSPSSSEVVSAAVNATASYGSTGSYYPTTAGSYSGATAAYGGISGLSTTGTTLLGSETTTSTDDAMAIAQSTMEQGQLFSVNMLILQQENQQMGLSNNLISNVLKARDDTAGAIVRNIHSVG